MGNYDRVVVQELLKEVAQTQQVDQSARQRFKVVVINEADHLTRDAQAALRRTMEKYSPNLRLILLANSTSNIIAPIRSRTLLVRVAAPSETEICAVLKSAAAKENWASSDALNLRIARESGRNLRRALLMFEAIYAQKLVLSMESGNFDDWMLIWVIVAVRKYPIKLQFPHRIGRRSSPWLRTTYWQSDRRREYCRFGNGFMIC